MNTQNPDFLRDEIIEPYYVHAMGMGVSAFPEKKH